MFRVVQQRSVVLVFLCVATVFVWVWPFFVGGADTTYLTVSFLDVGQGDAILVQSPTGTQVLIDGGSGPQVLSALARELPLFDRTLDMVIATHPDMDHIGGLVDVLEYYEVTALLQTENESDTAVYRAFLEAVTQEHATEYYARAGMVYDLGGGVQLVVLYPVFNPEPLESNTSSIVLQVTYGDVSFLLTGDAPQTIEQYLVSSIGTALQSDVLKAGHHGSKTSSSEVFIDTVAPEVVVISAGRDNRYSHPHEEVLERFREAGVSLRSTVTEGTITFTSDGVAVW